MRSQSPGLREGGVDKHESQSQVSRCPGRGPTLAHGRLYPTTPAPPGSWGKRQRYHQGEAVFFTSLALSPEPRFLQREQYRALHLGRLQEALEQSHGVQSPWGKEAPSFRFSFPDGRCWGHGSARRVNSSMKTHSYGISHSYLIS